MMTPEEAVIVFARRPRVGSSKTRLSPPLTLEQAAELYTCFLHDTLTLAEACCPPGAAGAPARWLAYLPDTEQTYFTGLLDNQSDWQLLPQRGGDLGERMHRAFEDVLRMGVQRAILIGSDLPHLPPGRLSEALVALRAGAEVVLGPTHDGGYYLVGLLRPAPELFDLPMGHAQVLAHTLQRAARLGLEVTLLPPAFDIDTAADLDRLRRLLTDDPSIPAAETRGWLRTS